MQIDVNQLNIGDIFEEDCYSERYKVIRFERQNGLDGVIAVDLAGDGEEIFFGGRPPFGPILNLLELADSADSKKTVREPRNEKIAHEPKYAKCSRCHVNVTILNDGRPTPHLMLNGFDWCEGAHRPKQLAPKNLHEHRLRHQDLYRKVREAVDDMVIQENVDYAKISVRDFVAWCKRQHDVPDHDDLEPHN